MLSEQTRKQINYYVVCINEFAKKNAIHPRVAFTYLYDYKGLDFLEENYDIVIGPVANDDLALLFRQFSGGLIGVETLVREMKYKILTDQYSFHSDSATKILRKSGVYYV
jgi:hypothetical protein